MDTITLDEYFMGVALLSAYRSADPKSKVGSCIVDPKNRIIGIGFNNFPTRCTEGSLPWSDEGDYLDTKYPYVCHSELIAIFNSLINSVGDLSGCRIYLNFFPCGDCTKAIIQVGINEVIYLKYNKSPESDTFRAARKLFDSAGVAYRQLKPSIGELTIHYNIGQTTSETYPTPVATDA